MRILQLGLSAMAREPARLALSRAVVAAWCVLAAAGLRAQTIYVDVNTGDDTRTGLGDWTNAVQTISNGVSLAETGYTVLVATVSIR